MRRLASSHRASGVSAGIMGSRILALQWSHWSLHLAPVMETAGQAFLPHTLTSEDWKALKVGV